MKEGGKEAALEGGRKSGETRREDKGERKWRAGKSKEAVSTDREGWKKGRREE